MRAKNKEATKLYARDVIGCMIIFKNDSKGKSLCEEGARTTYNKRRGHNEKYYDPWNSDEVNKDYVPPLLVEVMTKCTVDTKSSGCPDNGDDEE